MNVWKSALLCYAPAVLFLAVITVAAHVTGRAPSWYTRDPVVLLDAHPLIGIVSHVGILVWAATASICLFTAMLLRTRNRESPHWMFLLWGGLLTCWLLLDDLFLFHEWLFPEVLGIRTRFVFAGYIAVTAFFLVRFARLILRTDYQLLVLALAGFAISVGLDVLPEAWFGWDYLFLIEDSAKLLGIVGWFAYFVRVSGLLLENRESVVS